MHAEPRGGRQVSSSIALCLVYLRWGVVLTVCEARLVASKPQWFSCLHIHSTGVIESVAMPNFLHGCWRFILRSSRMCRKHSYPPNQLPSPRNSPGLPWTSGPPAPASSAFSCTTTTGSNSTWGELHRMAGRGGSTPACLAVKEQMCVAKTVCCP